MPAVRLPPKSTESTACGISAAAAATVVKRCAHSCAVCKRRNIPPQKPRRVPRRKAASTERARTRSRRGRKRARRAACSAAHSTARQKAPTPARRRTRPRTRAAPLPPPAMRSRPPSREKAYICAPHARAAAACVSTPFLRRKFFRAAPLRMPPRVRAFSSEKTLSTPQRYPVRNAQNFPSVTEKSSAARNVSDADTLFPPEWACSSGKTGFTSRGECCTPSFPSGFPPRAEQSLSTLKMRDLRHTYTRVLISHSHNQAENVTH